jgi:hypothetical protein
MSADYIGDGIHTFERATTFVLTPEEYDAARKDAEAIREGGITIGWYAAEAVVLRRLALRLDALGAEAQGTDA